MGKHLREFHRKLTASTAVHAALRISIAQPLALAAMLMHSTSAVPATGPATITISDIQTASALVRHRRGAFAPGDVEIIQQALFNRRVSPHPIGHADIVCTLLTRHTRACTGTYSLPKGQIVTSGSLGTQELFYDVAVIGGTELYDNARGSLVVTTAELKPRQELLFFRLTG